MESDEPQISQEFSTQPQPEEVVPARMPTPQHEGATTAEPPHAGHEEPATNASIVQTASFRKPVPFPDPIAMPSPTAPAETYAYAPSLPSAPHTPSSILNVPGASTSGATTHPSGPQTTGSATQYPGVNTYPGTSGGAIAGPSRRQTQIQIQESDEELREHASTPHRQHHTSTVGEGGYTAGGPQASGSTSGSASGSGNGGGNGIGMGHVGGNGNGSMGGSTPTTSIRRPARAVSIHERLPRNGERYPAYKGLPATPMGQIAGVAGASVGPGGVASNPEGFMSHASGDWNLPNVPYMGRVEGLPQTGSGILQGGGAVPGLMASRNGDRRRSGATTVTLNSNLEKNIGDRIRPTLLAAQDEYKKAESRAKFHGWALNIAIGAQVLLGALTTGVAAAVTGRSASIGTSILGGLSTLAASYLAKARGSGEPEASARQAQELSSFIRDCESFELDHGHKTGMQQDDMINRYRRRFEEIMGNNSEGVGDDVTVRKRQQSTFAGKEREKNDSPV